jgi:hypothetical protein
VSAQNPENVLEVNQVAGLEIVPLNWSINAMQRAFERVRSIGWNDVIGQYAAVAETLFWIDIVEAQLRDRYRPHYKAALNDQSSNVQPMLKGLLWARNRITHEVDEVQYLLATATSADSFAAAWTWQSIPPRPAGRYQDPDGHAAYESEVVGKDVVDTLLDATVCLGQAMARL